MVPLLLAGRDEAVVVVVACRTSAGVPVLWLRVQRGV